MLVFLIAPFIIDTFLFFYSVIKFFRLFQLNLNGERVYYRIFAFMLFSFVYANIFDLSILMQFNSQFKNDNIYHHTYMFEKYEFTLFCKLILLCMSYVFYSESKSNFIAQCIYGSCLFLFILPFIQFFGLPGFDRLAMDYYNITIHH
jgi:hypothetical protein